MIPSILECIDCEHYDFVNEYCDLWESFVEDMRDPCEDYNYVW